MPIYTNDLCDDGFFPMEPSLRSSIGIGPKVTKAIDTATKDWLDNHPEATTTVEDDSITNVKLKDGSVNSRTIEDESITTDDIADLAVTTSKIADNAVTATKIASTAADGLRTMSTTQLGVAKVGAGLAMNGQALELDGNGDIATAVTSWLNAHPEATTTVENGSISTSKLADASVTEAKMASALMAELIKGIGNAPANVTLTDANTAERNTVLLVTSTSGIANLPTDVKGFLVTIGNGKMTSATSSALQMYITTEGNVSQQWSSQVFIRSRYGASDNIWSTWNKVFVSLDGNIKNGSVTFDKLASALTNTLLVSKGFINNSTDPIDANTVPRGTVYFITSTGTCENMPTEGDHIGFLVTFGSGTGTAVSSVAFQMFASVKDVNTTTIPWLTDVWVRSRYGASTSTWSEWTRLLTDDGFDIKQTFGDIALYETVGVFGDSYASGNVTFPDSTYHGNYKLSWPSILSRQKGFTLYRYSTGGFDTYNCVNNTGSDYNNYGMGKLIADFAAGNKCQLFLLCFGINDASSSSTYGDKTGGMDYLGSSEDIDDEDYTNNANSFWGNYGRIIGYIQENSPASRIVMCTFQRTRSQMNNSTTYAAYNEAIKQIAAYFGLPCLVLQDDAFFNSSYYLDGMVNSHPTGPQYAGYANAINRLLAKSMQSNYSYFQLTQIIE